MEINNLSSSINSVDSTKLMVTSKGDTDSEKFSDQLTLALKYNTLKKVEEINYKDNNQLEMLNPIKADTEDFTKGFKATEIDENEKKVIDYIVAFLQGNINLDTFKEEVRDASISSNEKKILINAMSIIKLSESLTDDITNINNEITNNVGSSVKGNILSISSDKSGGNSLKSLLVELVNKGNENNKEISVLKNLVNFEVSNKHAVTEQSNIDKISESFSDQIISSLKNSNFEKIEENDDKDELVDLPKEFKDNDSIESDKKLLSYIEALLQGKVDLSKFIEEGNEVAITESNAFDTKIGKNEENFLESLLADLIRNEGSNNTRLKDTLISNDEKNLLLNAISVVDEKFSNSITNVNDEINNNVLTTKMDYQNFGNALTINSQLKTNTEIISKNKEVPIEDDLLGIGVSKNEHNVVKSLLLELVNKEKNNNIGSKDALKVLNSISYALENINVAKSDVNKSESLQGLQAIISDIVKEVEKEDGKTTAIVKNNSIGDLLETRFIATKRNINNFEDASKANDVKADDVLSSLIKKKPDKSNTAMLKINEMINSLNNQNNISDGHVTNQPIVINKNYMIEDVIKTIKFMNTNEIKELTVKINPKELGEVVIKLVLDGNVMKANIQASNKETLNLLNSQINDLSKNLQEIKVQDISISIYQEDTTFFAGQFNRQSQNGEQKQNKRQIHSSNNINIDDVEKISEPMIESNINALA